MASRRVKNHPKLSDVIYGHSSRTSDFFGLTWFCFEFNSYFSFVYNLVAHFDERNPFCICIQKIWSKCSIYTLIFLLDIFRRHDRNFHLNTVQLTVELSVFLLCVHGKNLYGFRPFHLCNSTKHRNETFLLFSHNLSKNEVWIMNVPKIDAFEGR